MEIAELGNLLQRPGTRLVTVIGVGGSGKSRVAVAVAEKMRESFANGVAFVDIAPIEDPQLPDKPDLRAVLFRQVDATARILKGTFADLEYRDY
jgi:predicted ATPase